MSRADSGSVSAFVVMMVLTFMVCAGLAFDGGRLVSSHVSAADHAENAARVGAQELTGLRGGVTWVDRDRAVAAVQQYLRLRGLQGSVSVSATRVTVTVVIDQPFALLRLVGLDGKRVSATRSAEPVRG